MKTLRLSALAAAAALAFTGCEQKPELHIYTWSDYIAPEVIEGFQEKYGCTVVVDTFDANETMYAKLKAGGSGYDIITPSSYIVPLMAKEGLIAKLDHTKMPNVKQNFDPRFATQILDPSFAYNVPYTVTYTGFMVIKDKVPEGVDAASWSILDNPAVKGKATLLDDIREVIGAGLMANGFSNSSSNPAEIDKAVETVLRWRQNIRKFDAESYKTEVASGATWIGHGYSTDATQVILGDEEEDMAPRPDIAFVLPKEGFSIAFDEMVLSSEAPNADLAYKFMDYVYDGENAKANMEFIMGPSPVKPGIDALDEDYRNQIVLDEETIARGQVIRPVDDETLELYNKAWDKIKATSIGE